MRRSLSISVLSLAALALGACGALRDGGNAASGPAAYASVMDFKAMARARDGKRYYLGPRATPQGAADGALALCAAHGEDCRLERIGATRIANSDPGRIAAELKTYAARLTAQARRAAEAGDAAAANWLAYHHAVLGTDLDLALRLATRAHDAAPDDPAIRNTLGFVLHRMGRHADAEPHLIAAARDAPTAEHIKHFADNAMAQGKLAQARAAYMRALDAGADPRAQTAIRQRLDMLTLREQRTVR